MSEEWLIDGYNVLYEWRHSGARDASRETLFTAAASFASGGERTVLVVLDGIGPDDELTPFGTASFRAVYSQKVNADSYIERYLFSKTEAGRAKTVVVTRDSAIRTIARGAGARVFAPAEFAVMIAEGGKESDERASRHRVRSLGFNRPFDKLKDPEKK